MDLLHHTVAPTVNQIETHAF
ncbi:hypothetical protein [Hymenobacter sp. HDW8]